MAKLNEREERDGQHGDEYTPLGRLPTLLLWALPSAPCRSTPSLLASLLAWEAPPVTSVDEETRHQCTNYPWTE